MDAIVDGNMKKAKIIAQQTIDQRIEVNSVLDILMKAMKTVDERYERKEYFVIDVASSALAMQEAFTILEPYLEIEPAMMKGKIVIGSLKGNIQSLGKNIVAATLQSAGFQVLNLGEDVAPLDFVKAAARKKAQILAISISMKETIPYLREVTDILKRKNLRGRVKVMIGGNAVSEQTCRDYELDAYAADAQDSLKKVKILLSQKIL